MIAERFVFADPELLWLAAAIPLALLLRWRRGAPAISFAPGVEDASGACDLPRTVRSRLVLLPGVMSTFGLLLVVVALARPQDQVPLPLEADGIDILLCLDASSSMEEKDMAADQTRLDVAKEAAARFIQAREHDRIGLIRFARYPDVLCPPTLDHAALLEMLRGVERADKDGEEDQTGIGGAVAAAAKVLKDSAAASKLVILLTDGEENVATEDAPEEIGPRPAAQLCEAFSVRVYTAQVGIGRRVGGSFEPIDTAQVKDIAERTGGVFLEAKDEGQMARVYQTISELERVRFHDPRFEIEDRFLPLLAAAFALLAAGFLLRALGLEVAP